MPLSKASVGVHGEHLLADEHGMVPTADDGPEALDWGARHHPGHPDDPEPEDGGHPIRYADWEHYRHVCLTAQARAATAAAE